MLLRILALVMLTAQAAGSAPAQDRHVGTAIMQYSYHQRVVVRVRRIVPTTPTEWRERKGPKCVAADRMAGAIIRPDGADLVLLGGDRLRVKLDGDCPALGFYSGFYLKPASDGLVCTGRDAIRSRAGDSCRIKGLKRLEPRR